MGSKSAGRMPPLSCDWIREAMRAERAEGKIFYLIPGCEHDAIVISKGIEVRMEEIVFV